MKKWTYILLIPIIVIVGFSGYLYYQETLPVEDLVYGDLEASIEIVNYTSFQCPPCAMFHETYGAVLEKYMDSGDIKLVLKAVDLDKFEYDEVIYKHLTDNQLTDYVELSKIYAKQDEWYSLDSKEEVISFLGLNEDKSRDLDRQIKQNSKERVKLGIKGVPTTFINGKEMELGITTEEFEAQILSLLEE
ncbi:thioredoxin domain-containing protein [Turicibacter bilis]|uniref:thioredoxin domain-containing protein n=1 Tax=Turicibacter bilis TaxID=2735723 RepID=UPI0006C35658|nr:thioredoxin domain-containing protein [Turicibacter bilis]MBS3203911.1 thioredoxin domain-containing protein [Turicibacter bilis]UUF11123.1 thioredoxin domain-containing protein [Turicibacter bilis]CUO15416.1 Protein-disulfide isomerase [Turicibacter sanguinis]